MKWRPDKVIERAAREVTRRAAAAIRSAAPRVQHRDGSAPRRGDVGGSLSRAVMAPGFVRVARWGAVIQWASLAQKALWFANGTVRQKARPFVLSPDVAALTAQLQADAARHYEARAKAGT